VVQGRRQRQHPRRQPLQPHRTFDTKLNVYCGECGNFICVDGVDDSCDGLGSNITWCSEAGKEYLILVHGFGGQTGTFDLVISDFGPAAPPRSPAPAGFCAADLTGSSDPNDPSYGVPDGLTDASDFFYYLDQFVNLNLAVADITGSSDPNDPPTACRTATRTRTTSSSTSTASWPASPEFVSTARRAA
jgi:hypothetical protein